MAQALDIPGLLNLKHPEPNYLSGGQPSAEQLAAAARSGIKRVINLRPQSENIGYDEATQARQLGLEYHVLPIAGAQDLNETTVRQLDELVKTSSAPTLVHCASGNRVGAMMALRAAWVADQSKAAAMEVGRQWGLTKMEPVVQRLLG